MTVAIVISIGGCVSVSQHEFAEPASGWQTRTGQLLVRSSHSTFIGDVIVRFSRTGDFELNFSKGPGLTLLAIREDQSFAQVKGALAQRGWSGPIDRAPAQLREWLGLREAFLKNPDRRSFRYKTDGQTFLFRL